MNINDTRESIAARLPASYRVGDVHYAGRYTDGELFKIECGDWEGHSVCRKPIEVHFEAQQSYNETKPGILRLDCHFEPYDEFDGLSESEYTARVGAQAVEKRIELMRALGNAVYEACPEDMKPRLRGSWQYNALWTAEWTLSDDDAAGEIEEIVLALSDVVTKTLRES